MEVYLPGSAPGGSVGKVFPQYLLRKACKAGIPTTLSEVCLFVIVWLV